MTTHPLGLGGQLTCSSGVQITEEKTHVAANEHNIFTHLFITRENMHVYKYLYIHIQIYRYYISYYIPRIHGCYVTV